MAQELKLRKEIFDKVLDGSKKATSRKGIRQICPGMLTLIMTEDETQTKKVCVKRVEIIKLNEITDTEARLEGYASAKELRNKLEEIYGSFCSGELFTLVEWF